MREKTGGNNVRQRGTPKSTAAAAFCQVDLDEVAVPACQTRKRVQRLDYPRALAPAAARTAGQANDRDLPGSERGRADLLKTFRQLRGRVD